MVALFALLLGLLMPVRGMFPPFYYEQYNRTKAKLEAIDGILITDSWKHEDIYLEDCGFDVTDGTASISLTFCDHQDWIGLFDRIDGIEYGPTNQRVFISRTKLNSAGLNIGSLTDILSDLSNVKSFCKSQSLLQQPGRLTVENPREKSRYWIRIDEPRN